MFGCLCGLRLGLSVSRYRLSSCLSQLWLCGIEEEAEAGKRRAGQGRAGQVSCLTVLLCEIEEEAEKRRAGQRMAGELLNSFLGS